MTRIKLWILVVIVVCPLVAMASQVGRAEVAYSNLSNDLGGGLFLSPNQTFWDDITPVHGGQLSELRTIVEYNVIGPRPDRFQGTVYFRHFGNPDSGQFGTPIASLTIDEPVTYDADNRVTLRLAGLSNLGIDLPSDRIAVGISAYPWTFLYYGPATVGSTTADAWFELESGELFVPPVPFFRSMPLELSVVPEPSSLALALIVGLVVCYMSTTRRFRWIRPRRSNMARILA